MEAATQRAKILDVDKISIRRESVDRYLIEVDLSAFAILASIHFPFQNCQLWLFIVDIIIFRVAWAGYAIPKRNPNDNICRQ